MSGDYWDGEARREVLHFRLHDAEQLWEVVYDRLDSAFADIEASRPTLDELEEGTAEDDGPGEVAIMREASYEIVQAALVYLRP